MWLSDNQKIGLGLCLFGAVFMALGVVFLDAKFLSLGNVLFVVGVMLVWGVARTARVAVRRDNWKPLGCFLAGFILVLFRRPLPGLALETVSAAMALYQMAGYIPVLSTLLGLARDSSV